MRTPILLVAALASACVLSPETRRKLGTYHVEHVSLSPEQRAHVDKIRSEPLTFDLNKDQAADAWGRAQAFVGQFSDMKIQLATEYVIETYNATEPAHFTYSVQRVPAGAKHQFTVRCSVHSDGSIMEYSDRLAADAALNAGLAAHFIRTGERVCDACVADYGNSSLRASLAAP